MSVAETIFIWILAIICVAFIICAIILTTSIDAEIEQRKRRLDFLIMLAIMQKINQEAKEKEKE